MRTGITIAQPRVSAGATFSNMPPPDAYQAWLDAWALTSRNRDRRLSATLVRRLVALRRAGDNFAEIGRCVGMTGEGASLLYHRLPEHLR